MADKDGGLFHSKNSYHYKGQAVDLAQDNNAGPDSYMRALASSGESLGNSNEKYPAYKVTLDGREYLLLDEESTLT